MSLYGSGRAEGIAATGLVGVIVVLARAIAAWYLGEPLPDALAPACLPALGGMLAYRFLRAQGRSRFSGFLAGAAYGMSPWLLALHQAPREQLAAALAMFALETASRCDRPAHRAAWLPWAWLGLAVPFLAGATVVGTLASVLCLAMLVRTFTCGDREAHTAFAGGVPLLAGLAGLAAANLLWLDPLGALLPAGQAVPVAEVLALHRPLFPGIDLAAVLRIPGPVLLTLALLGVLRRQRHVDAATWAALAVAGCLPMLGALLPVPTLWTVPFLQQGQVPTGALWLLLLAATVLAAAGLDDFLDLPLRRRTALPWLLALAVAGAPWLPVCGARAPTREWPLTTAFLALAVLLPTWRRLGILRFKNWLAAMVVVALAAPMLQIELLPPEYGPAPLVETMPVRAPASPGRPLWHYAGLAVVLLGGGAAAAASAWRRSRHASTSPAAAKAAIVKKARPSQRS